MSFTPRNQSHIAVRSITTLLEGWSKVVRIAYDVLRRDGQQQRDDRDLLDRGDGISVLLYDRVNRNVLLLVQPRIIAAVHGADSHDTIEVCNGAVEDGESPEACALREVEQETGLRVDGLLPLTRFYASPGASLEIVHVFLAFYEDAMKTGLGGGVAEEGEDIQLIEVPVASAVAWAVSDRIFDGRSKMAILMARQLGYLDEGHPD